MRKIILASAMALVTMASAYAGEITGAGSTFAAPIYTKWAGAAVTNPKVTFNYQAIGSGAGINQIINRTVDFGATDMPLSDEKLKAANLAQFPTAIGGVVIIVNIPGVESNTVKLTGELLAEIYSGKIKKWDDPKIVALNPNLHSNIAIAPVYRADGSGTTFVFTDYLTIVSPENWTGGAGTSVKWNAGTGAKGNDGVAAVVASAKGAIGYVESAYAETNHLTTVQLKNRNGKFVSPNMETFRAAAAAAAANWSLVKNYAIDLNNQEGDNSWPIESATFILIPTNSDAAKLHDIHALFGWALKEGDDIALSMKYVPLPASVKDEILKAWK